MTIKDTFGARYRYKLKAYSLYKRGKTQGIFRYMKRLEVFMSN